MSTWAWVAMWAGIGTVLSLLVSEVRWRREKRRFAAIRADLEAKWAARGVGPAGRGPAERTTE